MKYSCKEIEELMVDYLDNTLSESNKRVLEQHIASCQQCRSALALQKQWLQHSTQFAVADPLDENEVQRLKASVMEAVRSSQQAERAARYISDYHTRSRINEQENPDNEAIAGTNHRIDVPNPSLATTSVSDIKPAPVKNRNRWRRPGMLAGYAAMLVLLVIAGLLFQSIVMGQPGFMRSQAVPGSAKDGAELDAFLEETGEMTIMEASGGAVDDRDMGVESESAGQVDEGGSMSVENGDTEEANQWQVFSGKLTDLAAISSLFDKRVSTPGETTPVENGTDGSASETTSADAEATVEALTAAKAIRILTRQTAVGPDDADSKETERVPTDNDTTELLILTAWPKNIINSQMDKLTDLLRSSQSRYTIQAIETPDQMRFIENEIGVDPYTGWVRQIDEQGLQDFYWIAIRIGG